MKEFDNQFDLAFKIVLEINIENGKTAQYNTGLVIPKEKYLNKNWAMQQNKKEIIIHDTFLYLLLELTKEK